MKVVELFGYRFSNKSLADVVTGLNQFDYTSGFNHVVTMNPIIFIRSEFNSGLKSIVNQANLILVDGIGLKWAIKLLKKISVNMVTGIDLCYYLLAQKGFSCYLLGGTPKVLKGALNTIKKEFPNTTVLGSHHGFFSKDELPAIINDIKSVNAPYIFVATGFPYQELIIKALRDTGCTGTAIGIGGVFDVLSGLKKPAPTWVKKCQLEWAYRSFQDIKRLPRLRYLIYFVIFIMTAFFKKKVKSS